MPKLIQPRQTHFGSLADLEAHIKGKDWTYIKAIVEHDVDALEPLERWPKGKKLAHPLSDYHEDLLSFQHYVLRGGVSPAMRERPKALFYKTMERIQEDLANRGQWPSGWV